MVTLNRLKYYFFVWLWVSVNISRRIVLTWNASLLQTVPDYWIIEKNDSIERWKWKQKCFMTVTCKAISSVREWNPFWNCWDWIQYTFGIQPNKLCLLPDFTTSSHKSPVREEMRMRIEVAVTVVQLREEDGMGGEEREMLLNNLVVRFG